MRIISGYLKGKKINLPKDKKTRPLKDMVKESIFNILTHSNKINFQIKNSEVLDLFSGSGSFGLECISRGAKSVYFNETYIEALEILKKNIDILDCSEKSIIIEEDCFKVENTFKNFNKKFDLIFIDPPFKEERVNILIESLINLQMLKANGVMIVHRNKKNNEILTGMLNIVETRVYGASNIIFGNYFLPNIL